MRPTYPYRTPLSTVLKEWREDRKITQEALSERTSIGVKSLSSFETGARTPSANQVVSICEALGVAVAELADAVAREGGHPVLEAEMRLADVSVALKAGVRL